MQEPGASSTSGPEGTFALVSLVWLRGGSKGIYGGTAPGLLIAREGGRISFVTQTEKVFEAEGHEIGVNWPWWEFFGAGVHLKVAGKTYRLSFGEPHDFEGPVMGKRERERLVSTLAGRAGLDFTGISSIDEALASAKAWKSYLNT